MSVKVLFVDNHLLALEKPAGLTTQPNAKSKSSLEEDAKKWIKQKYNKKGRVFLECIHRLDKPVSGIVVFARTSKALKRAQREIREKNVQKVYLALVEGILKKKKGRLVHHLIHGEYKALVQKGGKESILEYKVRRSMKEVSLVEIQLITGRYHQIRAQFSEIGHPIVGDRKYHSHFFLKDAIALHHYKMQIKHPVKDQLLRFTSKALFLDSIQQFLSRTSGRKK